MDLYGADRERLETVVYNLIKTCMSNFTDALDIFTEVRTNISRCAGKLWVAILEKYPLEDTCAKHLLFAREISRVVRPVTDCVENYNIHSAAVATQLLAFRTVTITPSDLFALVELASYKDSPDKHLRKAFRDITEERPSRWQTSVPRFGKQACEGRHP